MKKVILFSILFLVSCSRTYYEGYTKKDVSNYRNIGIIQPMISITEVGKKYQKKISDYDLEIINHFNTKIEPVLIASDSELILFDSTKIDEKLIRAALNDAFRQQNIDSSNAVALNKQFTNQNKLLLVYVSGWYKTPDLVSWETTKSILSAIFTLGMYTKIYYQYRTSLHSAMLDLTTNKVVYKEYIHYYEDPRTQEALSKLVDQAIIKYF